MSENNPHLGRLRSAASATTDLASAWTEAQTAKLKYRAHTLQSQLESPDSWIATGGSDAPGQRFTERTAQRDQLQTYHNIRLDGGIVSTLLEARALMVFGVGGQFTHDQDVVAEYLNNSFDQLDLLTFDIGADALFYGYSLGEIRETVTGDFGRLEFIEPWTTVPKVSNKGEILSWEQEVDQRQGKRHTQEFDPDEIFHFSVMKASGRDPVGMSMLGRAMDEATAYRDNQEAIQNAVTLHGFPKWHIKIGREGGGVVDDNELRRARPKFDNIDELTKWVTGRDVDIETISPEGMDFENITEHDLSKLAIAFMLPVELTQISGGDGLGTGFPARLRERLFLLSAQAQQNQLAGQLVDDLARTVIREYSPFDEDVVDELEFAFNDPITDVEELQQKVDAVGSDMTVNERRELFDLPALDDEGVGESFEPPGEPEPAGGGGPFGMSELQQPQRGDGGVAAESLEWISRYAQTDGSVDELIGDWLDWLETTTEVDQADPARARVGVELFAADQGIGFDEAVDQPLNNLVRFYHRNRTLAEADTDADTELFEWEDYFESMLEEVVWADDTDHKLFGFSEGSVPAFAKARLFEAVLEGSPIFSDIESIPSSELMDFRVFMADQLTEDGWTISGMMDDIQDRFDVDEQRSEVIARSTTQNMVSEAAEEGYREREDFDELRFDWSGPSDHRNSDVCPEIKSRVPDGGMQLDELKTLVEETAQEFDLDPRGWSPHPQCRHRPVRVVE